MPNRRLLWQLFPTYLIITVGALVMMTLYGSRMLREFYLDQLAGGLEARAALFSELVESHVADKDYEQIDRFSKKLGGAIGTRFTFILTDGKVVADTEENPARMENHKDRTEVGAALEGHNGRSVRFSDTIRKDMMYIAIPVREDGKIVAVSRASITVAAIDETLGKVHVQLVTFAVISSILVAIVSLIVSRQISKPLEHMRVGAERFAKGDLKLRLAVPDSAELKSLAEALNNMATQLDERINTILRQRNEQDAVLTSMVEGVIAIDNDGTIININKAGSRLLGIAEGDVEGRTIHEVIRKPDLLKFVEATLASSSTIEDSIQIFSDNGDRYLNACGTILRDAEHRSIGALIVLHDVTTLRRLENIRRDFVANVSHELRTPITSIKGFVETLLDGALEDQENAERFLQIILKQTDRLSAIIGDLLSLSRIERDSEQESIELARGPIKPVIHSAVQMCENQAAEKDVVLNLSCEENLEANINSQLLEQAVVNLIDNAVKYSPLGAQVQVSAFRESGAVIIQVVDEGCGIPEKHHARLFERFYRVDKARSRELGGTGLGLSIVKHIALAHRGSVSVKSTVGSGSTFRIVIPTP
ncbi:MAG: PAS domain-containing protein [Planctomycetes bacterium]|nr:PAS domain-containing protein [Planctomycetota bacterium]